MTMCLLTLLKVVVLNKLVAAVGKTTADQVSRDTLLAHSILIQRGQGPRVPVLAKALAKDASLVKNVPLPPLDVAMYWHSHILSPIRYIDDMQRLFGFMFDDIEYPLMRLAKAATGANKDDLDAGRSFWAAHMPADMPYDLTPDNCDTAEANAKVHCPSCVTDQPLAMGEYAPFRLHGKPLACTSCSGEFTAENVATCMPVPKMSANLADLDTLFNKAAWAKHVTALPALATWSDVRCAVFKPIMASNANSLKLPGCKARFSTVQRAHNDVVSGPWSMDMISTVAKIVDHGLSAVFHWHTEALMQYPKFLAAVAVARKDKISQFVLTDAIDLSWQTHQLFPAAYRAHTRTLHGSVINHDDSDDPESEARIADSAKAMLALRMALFDEDYFRPNVTCADGAKFPMHAAPAMALGIGTVKKGNCKEQIPSGICTIV
ncbi:hypothetical protein GGF32_005981 [Allomyces javanicus]|nr:hypothetical protein GGF32_005981 [Allomyces javanicus]